MKKPIILGSASERRKAILGELGVAFEVYVPRVAEVFYATEPRLASIENARRKHNACKRRFQDRVIITADTVVAFAGQCVAKPGSLAEAATFLRMFSGRSQQVLTAVALSRPKGEPELRVEESIVVFRKLSEATIAAYLAKVNPLDKAGGYDINQCGDLIVQSYSGSYTNIMGLPKEVVADWLTRGGLPMIVPPLRIGNLTFDSPVLLAPMAGYTDSPFRLLCRRYGCGAVFTEVVNAEGIVRGSPPTLHLLEALPEERPIAAHIYGCNPDSMAEAAARIERLNRFDFIDINAGCPVRKIVAKGAGAALMKQPEKLEAIVRAICGAVKLPVTVKTRIGYSPEAMNISEVAHAVEAGGGQAIFIHARFATHQHRGPADWPTLARIQSERTIPVVGNGGIATAQDALDLFAQTGVKGAMIGRAAVGNPWIFGEIRHRLDGVPYIPHSIEEHRSVILEHVNRLTALARKEHRRKSRRSIEDRAALHFRAHLVRYLAGFRGFADVRRRLQSLQTVDALWQAIEGVLANETTVPERPISVR